MLLRWSPLCFGISAVALAAVVACEERFPDPLKTATTAPPTESPVGIDARPYNPECVAKQRPSTKSTLIGLQAVSSAPLTSPVEIVVHDGKTYVVEQAGRVLILSDDGASTSTAVTIPQGSLVSGGEAGLLGLAFHPKFSQNGFVYLYYTAPNRTGENPTGPFQSAIVRMTSTDNGLTFDLATEKRILTIDQPFGNHNGGTLAFGPDGFLYFGTGDGGSGGDPGNRAQNKNELLGKILRIDVDGGDPYAIPPSNPFAVSGGAKEVYALGLRNPYRFRFDDVTGTLWAGDVGQGAREEIDKITLGGNYGWNIREGKICYPETAMCDPTGLIDPVVDHGRTEATAITGGVVYRGAAVPLLTGKYVYADFGQSTFFAIAIDQASPTPLRLDEGLPRINPSAFAIDKNGEILVAGYTGGKIYRVVAGGEPVPEMPRLLTETGCFDAIDPKKTPEGLLLYDVNVAQWVDGEAAERYMSIPETSAIRVSPEGTLALPIGSVVVKTLRAEGRRLETQMLLHRPASAGEVDVWDAYTYVWNAEQTNATLATGAQTITLPSGRTHSVVDRAQCISCHAPNVVPTIGLEAAQLDRDDVDYGNGRLGNPLATLEKLKIIEEKVPRDTYRPLARLAGFDTSERRARSYLHANCAFCHRGGPNLIDLRVGTPLRSTLTCDVPGTSKAGGRARVAPGAPAESQLYRSMQTTGEGRMPPFGTTAPDDAALVVVSSWIEAISACD